MSLVEVKGDLHIHSKSPYTDGSATPEQIVWMVYERSKLDFFSVTDDNWFNPRTQDYFADQAVKAVKAYIPGVEIHTRDKGSKKPIHLVLHFVEPLTNGQKDDLFHELPQRRGGIASAEEEARYFANQYGAVIDVPHFGRKGPSGHFIAGMDIARFVEFCRNTPGIAKGAEVVSIESDIVSHPWNSGLYHLLDCVVKAAGASPIGVSDAHGLGTIGRGCTAVDSEGNSSEQVAKAYKKALLNHTTRYLPRQCDIGIIDMAVRAPLIAADHLMGRLTRERKQDPNCLAGKVWNVYLNLTSNRFRILSFSSC